MIVVPSVSSGKDSSATLLLALEHNAPELVRPAFADTANEHDAVYDYLGYLEDALKIQIKRLKADFSEWMAHRRRFVADPKYEAKLCKGRDGYWVLRSKYEEEEEDDEVAGATVTAGLEIPPEPPPPADLYRGQETEFYVWKRAVAPLTVAEAREVVSRVLAALIFTGNPYLDLCVIKGRFPSRKAQFCTQFLKTEPLAEYQLELIAAHGKVESWQGVRADESLARRHLPEREDRGGGLLIYRPILSWTIEDVFAYMRKRGIKPNPLYLQGFTRVGCMPCIHAKKDELLLISKRYPGHIERVAMWEALVSAAGRRGEASFFPDPDRDAHLKRRGVHAMVEWSKTSRGGTQYDLLRINKEEGDGCSSAYGLCE